MRVRSNLPVLYLVLAHSQKSFFNVNVSARGCVNETVAGPNHGTKVGFGFLLFSPKEVLT